MITKFTVIIGLVYLIVGAILGVLYVRDVSETWGDAIGDFIKTTLMAPLVLLIFVVDESFTNLLNQPLPWKRGNK